MAKMVNHNYRLVAIWVRKREPIPGGGRPRIMAWLQDGPLSQALHVYLPQLFEVKNWEKIIVFLWGFWRAITLRPLPLQVLLFSAPLASRRILKMTGYAQVLYLDGIRCYMFAAYWGAGKHKHKPYIICDLDDLMSRRLNLYLQANITIHLGYIAQSVPKFIKKILNTFSYVVAMYERFTLLRAEYFLAKWSDKIILLSQVEKQEFANRLPLRLRGKIHCILPAQPIVHFHESIQLPMRCIFIGSDELPQNRLTLLRLIKWWKASRMSYPLYWFGKRTYLRDDFPSQFHAMGFVDDLSEIYDGHSVLLMPAILCGGIKTKVLEALAHGCPVVGNDVAFEGLPWKKNYPLILSNDDGEWIDFITCLPHHRTKLLAALKAGYDCLRRYHTSEIIAQQWNNVLNKK